MTGERVHDTCFLAWLCSNRVAGLASLVIGAAFAASHHIYTCPAGSLWGALTSPFWMVGLCLMLGGVNTLVMTGWYSRTEGPRLSADTEPDGEGSLEGAAAAAAPPIEGGAIPAFDERGRTPLARAMQD
jgi:hypothetical protein